MYDRNDENFLLLLKRPKQRAGFRGTTLLGAELGNFNYGAGRHVLSSSGSLDFRPGKTLYLSVDFSASAGSSNEMLVGYYSGTYSAGGKGWTIERGASSDVIYLTKWDGTAYVALATNVRLGVRQLAITWKSADNTIWVSMDGSAAASVGSLTAPNSDGTCVVAVGSPITTGSAYADSLTTGGVCAFGLIASELSSGNLAAASNSMNGTTPLNRFVLPSQYTSPVVDFNAYRDWNGVASTITTQGSSPVTLTVTGAISRTDTSEVYYATVAGMYHDNGLALSETYAVRHNAFARIRFTTSSRRIACHQTSTIQGMFTGSYASIGIFINGTYSALSTSTVADTSQVIDTTLASGSNKTVDLVEGCQAYVSSYIYGTFISGIRLPLDARIIAPSSPQNRVVVIGDSIANGFVTTNAQSDNPIAVLRSTADASVTLLGWGSASAYTFMNLTDRATWTTRIANMLNGGNSNTLVFEVQTNDYGLAFQSAANYATYLGDFIDGIKALVPNLQVKLLGAISRIAPDGEGANGFGNTLDDYRSAAAGVVSGRSWVKYINNKNAVTSANHNADGIHISTAGALQLGYAFWGVIDFTVEDLASLALHLRADTGVTLNGSDVSQIDDQSGNSRNYSQGTAALQPAYNSTGINSLPTIDTTVAGGERLGRAFKISGAQSVFIVFKCTALPVLNTDFFALTILADANTPSGGDGSLILASNYSGYQAYSFGLGGAVSGAVAGVNQAVDTNPHFLLITYAGGGVGTPANYEFFLDGVEKTVVSSGAFISTLYGSQASIGATTGGSYAANVRFAEEAITSAVVSEAFRSALHAYAANRYAINP